MCIFVCVCVCLLKVLIKATKIELMEGIIKALSAGPIVSPSPEAGQRICLPLQHLPKGLLLTPLPLYPHPLISFFFSFSPLSVYSPSLLLLTLTCPGKVAQRTVFLVLPFDTLIVVDKVQRELLISGQMINTSHKVCFDYFYGQSFLR